MKSNQIFICDRRTRGPLTVGSLTSQNARTKKNHKKIAKKTWNTTSNTYTAHTATYRRWTKIVKLIEQETQIVADAFKRHQGAATASLGNEFQAVTVQFDFD